MSYQQKLSLAWYHLLLGVVMVCLVLLQCWSRPQHLLSSAPPPVSSRGLLRQLRALFFVSWQGGTLCRNKIGTSEGLDVCSMIEWVVRGLSGCVDLDSLDV